MTGERSDERRHLPVALEPIEIMLSMQFVVSQNKAGCLARWGWQASNLRPGGDESVPNRVIAAAPKPLGNELLALAT